LGNNYSHSNGYSHGNGNDSSYDSPCLRAGLGNSYDHGNG
jgi:hypothetical protein